jgi:hypothetical protein
MPLPCYGQLQYFRENKDVEEEYIRLLTPRNGGDSIVNQEDMIERQVALSGKVNPEFDQGTDMNSVAEKEDFLNRSEAGFSMQKTINCKDESEIY